MTRLRHTPTSLLTAANNNNPDCIYRCREKLQHRIHPNSSSYSAGWIRGPQIVHAALPNFAQLISHAASLNCTSPSMYGEPSGISVCITANFAMPKIDLAMLRIDIAITRRSATSPSGFTRSTPSPCASAKPVSPQDERGACTSYKVPAEWNVMKLHTAAKRKMSSHISYLDSAGVLGPRAGAKEKRNQKEAVTRFRLERRLAPVSASPSFDSC